MIRSEKGQATVELAFSLVILVFLLFGIIDFGRIFHVYLTLEHAGREAAREASVGKTDSEVILRAKHSASALDSDSLSVSITPSRANRTRGAYVTIQLTYPVAFSIPLFQNFLPDPLVIEAKTVMRVE